MIHSTKKGRRRTQETQEAHDTLDTLDTQETQDTLETTHTQGTLDTQDTQETGGTKRDRGGPTPAEGDLQKSDQRHLVLRCGKPLPESGRGFPLLEPTRR